LPHNESKTIKSRGSNPVIIFENRNFGSEVVGAQEVASKRFFAFFGLFRAQKKGRFWGFGSLDFISPLETVLRPIKTRFRDIHLIPLFADSAQSLC
jgi:hypothetical protein